MTIVLTEREAILRKMDYIEKERTALWTSYETCLDRLRELDAIDRLATQAVPTPIEKTTVKETVVVEEKPKKITEAEMQKAAEGIAKLIKENSHIDSEVPEHKAEQPIQEYIEENKQVVSLPEEEPKFEYNHAKELAKDLEYKNRNIKNPVRRGKYRDMSVLAQYAKVVLKEAGLPLKIKVLFEMLADINPEYVYKNPYDIMKKLTTIDPRIEKVSSGYYQYNTSK